MRKYHLSYDAEGLESPIAREFVIAVLKESGAVGVESHDQTSIIVSYNDLVPNLFNYIASNLDRDFYYSISLIENDIETGEPLTKNNPKPGQNDSAETLFQRDNIEPYRIILPYIRPLPKLSELLLSKKKK